MEKTTGRHVIFDSESVRRSRWFWFAKGEFRWYYLRMSDGSGRDGTGAFQERLLWRSRPLADDFPRSILFIAAFLAASAAVGTVFGGAGYALLAAALLAVSLGRYCIATVYTLDGRGITVRFLGQSRTVGWDRVKRVCEGPRGVFLSPFERPSRLDPFRGVFLRFSNGNGEKVLRFVRNKSQIS